MMIEMTEEEYEISRFDSAVLLMPEHIRRALRTLMREDRRRTEEIRLRRGRLPSVVIRGREIAVGWAPVTGKDIDSLLETATGASAYACAESVKDGYITAKNGYRIGLCGSAVVKEGRVYSFHNISSAAVRVSKEIRGICLPILDKLLDKNGELYSTLIISPPGNGKTTLLRDIVRILSDGGIDSVPGGFRVGLADERCEIASSFQGKMQFDVGKKTDVIDSCPKSEAVTMLLRAMNPQIIAVDEITAAKDAEVIENAVGCGVKVLATAHAGCMEDLLKRGVYRKLIDGGAFEKAVVIKNGSEGRVYEVCTIEENSMKHLQGEG